jgi:hypothetical protein
MIAITLPWQNTLTPRSARPASLRSPIDALIAHTRRLLWSPLLVLSAYCLLCAPVKADGLPIGDFEATYIANVKAISGKLRISMEKISDDRYRFSYSVRAGRFWNFFFRGKLEEHSIFEVNDGRPNTLEYELHNTIGSKPRNGEYVFDWADQQVSGWYKGEAVNLPTEPGLIDRSLLQLVLMWDLKNGKLQEEYSILDRDEISHVKVVRVGEEIIQLPSRAKYETVIISRISPDQEDVSTIWLAPMLGYLPVKLAQYTDGEQVFEAELIRLELLP